MQQSELQALGQHIQTKLQQLPSPIRLRVRCAFREEALLVLAEHLLHIEPSPRQTFTTVAEALQEFTPELMKSGLVRSGIGGTKFLPVRIYLRVAGYQQPYDSFVFSLKPSAPPVPKSPPTPTFTTPPVVAPLKPAPPRQVQVEPELVEPVAPVAEVEPVTKAELVEEIAPVAEVETITEVELLVGEQPESSNNPIAQITPAIESTVEPETVEPELVEIALAVEDEPAAEVLLTEESTPFTEPTPEIVEAEPVAEAEPATESEHTEGQSELLDNPIAQITPVIEPAIELATEFEPVTEAKTAAEDTPTIEPIVEPELVEITPLVEVEPITAAELTEEQLELSDRSIAEIVPAIEPVVEPEIVEPEILAVEPVIENELVEEVLPAEEITPIAQVEPITAAELTEEQPGFSDRSIAEIAPAVEPVVEPEIIAVEPIAEFEPVVEPAVEPEIVEPEILAVESVIEDGPVAEVLPAEEITPIAQVEPATAIELTEEQPELSDNSIAEIVPAVEPVVEPEIIAGEPAVEVEPVAEVLLDKEIAPVEEPVISEAAINEQAFAEKIEVEQLATSEEPIFEKDAELLPIAEETVTPPTIALSDISIKPKATEDFLPSEEVLSDLEEITPLPEATFVPAAIASVPDGVSLTADETSPNQNTIEDEPELANILLEDPIAIEGEPEPANILLEEPSIEELIAIEDEPEPIINLQEDPTVEQQSQSSSFSPPSPLQVSPPDLPPTQQDFFPEHLVPTDTELVDSAKYAEVEAAEIEEPAVEVNDLPELDATTLQSVLAPELRETPEPETPAIESDLPLEEIVIAKPAIAGETFTPEYPRTNDPTLSPASQAPEAPVSESSTYPIRAPQLSSSSIMLGTAIALFSLLGGWYIFSRPCVLGSSCEPLQQAQQISESAFQTVQLTDSAVAIAKAYDDLGIANKLLKSIPSWSGQYQAAQTLFADNESKSAVIGQLVRTLQKGNEAANRSQNPPHPLPEWREIQRLWRESIAALEKIPSNNAIYPVAQRKAAEYRANLDGINKRVIVEQQAQEEVENAKKTAQLAETRTGIATSAAGWQQVYTSWQASISLLKNVPQGAAARLEAEELLKIYQIKLAAAGTRRDQENAAIAAYNEAIAQAEQAQSFQQKNQWQRAVDAWESAVASVQKVAQGTTPYAQAQSLIATYQTALTQAQGGLRVSESIQAAKPALDRTCNGTPRVCQYDAAPTAIRVQITYGYDQMVETAMISAQAQGNSTAQAGVVSQVNTFLQELALISQTSQVPIELYNANGSKFGTYSPEASGFVPQ